MREIFLRLRFEGGEVGYGGLPLKMLSELATLERLLWGAAGELFRRENPNAKLPPQNTRLVLTQLGKGSTTAQIELDFTKDELFLPSAVEFLKRARKELLATIEEARIQAEKTTAFPTPLLRGFRRLGKSLGEVGQLHLESPDEPQVALLDAPTRNRLIEWAEGRQTTTSSALYGWICEIDERQRTFEIRLVNGKRLRGEFREEIEKQLIEALGGYHYGQLIRLDAVLGRDEKGRITSVKEVREAILLDRREPWSRLRELSKLPEGWLDGEGAPISSAAKRWVRGFLRRYYPPTLPPPYLYPTPQGGISLEWDIQPYMPSLEIDAMGQLGYWHALAPSNPDSSSEDRELSLNDPSQIKWLIERLRAYDRGDAFV
ncbi:MAG: hypothetical protein ABDH91_09070 [Bacteroidia bacterium]